MSKIKAVWKVSLGPPCLSLTHCSPHTYSNHWLVCVSFQSSLMWTQVLFLLSSSNKRQHVTHTVFFHLYCILELLARLGTLRAFSFLSKAEWCSIVWICHVFFNYFLADEQLGHFQFPGSFEVIPKYMINDSIVNFCLHPHFCLLPSFIRKSNSIPPSSAPFLCRGKKHLQNLMETGKKILQEMWKTFWWKLYWNKYKETNLMETYSIWG